MLDIINKTIFNKMIDNPDDTIGSNTRKRINKFKSNEKLKLFELIVDSQASAIRFGMENQVPINVPYLGQFKIKPGRRQALEIKRSTLKEHGIEDYDSLSDEKKEELRIEYTEKIRQRFLKNKQVKKETTPFNKPSEDTFSEEIQNKLKNQLDLKK